MKLYKNKLVDLLLEAKGDINWNAFIEHEAALIAMNDLKFGTKRKWVSSSVRIDLSKAMSKIKVSAEAKDQLKPPQTKSVKLDKKSLKEARLTKSNYIDKLVKPARADLVSVLGFSPKANQVIFHPTQTNAWEDVVVLKSTPATLCSDIYVLNVKGTQPSDFAGVSGSSWSLACCVSSSKLFAKSLQKKIKEAVEYGVPFGSNIGDYSMSKAAATKGNKKNKEIIELIISAYNATGSNLRASFEKYANMRFGQINQVFFRLYYTPTKGYKSDIHLRKPKINIKDTHAVKVDSEYGFNIVDKYKQVLYRMKVKTGTMRIQANKNIRGDVISRWNALAGLKEGDEYQAAAATQTLAQAQSASDYQPGPAPSDSVAGASAGEYSIEDFLVEEGVDVGVSDEIEGISLTQDAQIEIPQWEIEL